MKMTSTTQVEVINNQSHKPVLLQIHHTRKQTDDEMTCRIPQKTILSSATNKGDLPPSGTRENLGMIGITDVF
jgi:hypothetical protein